ncbi:MAG: flippase-like domain-containing protein [Planctomycetes bacterium]|nr:flippase-like domain-containing protein [Planctomycetota bacterium]
MTAPAEQPKPVKNGSAKTLGLMVVTLGCTLVAGWMIYRDFDGFVNTFSRIDAALFTAGVVVAFYGELLTSSVTNQRLFAMGGFKVSWVTLFAARASTQLIDIAHFTIGVGAKCWILGKRVGRDWRETVGHFLVSNFVDLSILWMFSVIGIFVAIESLPEETLLPIIVVGVVIVAIFMWWIRPLTRLLKREVMTGAVSFFDRSTLLAQFRNYGPREAFFAHLLRIPPMLVPIFGWYLAFRAFGFDVTPTVMFVAVPLYAMMGALPTNFAGIGAPTLVFVAILGAYGSKGEILAVPLTWHGAFVMLKVITGVIFMPYFKKTLAGETIADLKRHLSEEQA